MPIPAKMPRKTPAALARPDCINPQVSLTVQTAGNVSFAPLRPADLKRLVGAATARLSAPWELTLRFVARREAIGLNQAFRQAAYAPNVLTFEYPETRSADIVICPPVVRRQAAEQQKSYAHHLAHMVVHGVLHAIGYQHDKPAQAHRMEALERRILGQFEIADPYA